MRNVSMNTFVPVNSDHCNKMNTQNPCTAAREWRNQRLYTVTARVRSDQMVISAAVSSAGYGDCCCVRGVCSHGTRSLSGPKQLDEYRSACLELST